MASGLFLPLLFSKTSIFFFLCVGVVLQGKGPFFLYRPFDGLFPCPPMAVCRHPSVGIRWAEPGIGFRYFILKKAMAWAGLGLPPHAPAKT